MRGPPTRLPSLLHHWGMPNSIRIQVKAGSEGMARDQLTYKITRHLRHINVKTAFKEATS